jgi:hypothetical protein
MKTSTVHAGSFSGMILSFLMFLPMLLMAEGEWPKEIKTARSTIIIYQPQSDSMKADHLYSRAAISMNTSKNATPVFGAIWSDSRFSTDRETGNCTIYDVKILNVRFPGIDTIDPAKVQKLKTLLSEEATNWNLEFSLDGLKSDLALNQAAVSKSAGINNDPPEIIFVRKPSVLVLLDGDPVLKEVDNAGLKRVINTPFLILQDSRDKGYYLFGENFWYKSPDPVKGLWSHVATPSESVAKFYATMVKEMEKSDKSIQPAVKEQKSEKTGDVPSIVVRTKPAELIQSKGEPVYAPIQGTQILYMTNTDDNIFMTIDKNQYYILISGRWYVSAALNGPWSFIESENLPPDFARIPEGSDKDIVLASIAGTDAARDAVMDAQIPQTAAVDPKTAKCEVNYDGDPKFETIRGTELERGMNTSSTVLLYRKAYYVCDNAIWFTGFGPTGPWVVATSVPDEFQRIPPDDPSYNVKYVYIYDVQPDVIYVGYTPGYMGCYVYGPTVVYGTGFPYVPFYGPYYYPRPVTYGFNMHYNPWCGWSMGFSMSVGMCTFSMGGYHGYHGGYWGPPMYRPPYNPHYSHYYGSRPPAYHGGYSHRYVSNNRNVYNGRHDGSTRPSRQPSVSNRPGSGNQHGGRPSAQPNTRPSAGDRPGSRPSAQPSTRERNNVFTDQKGDVYRNKGGDWQRNTGKNWESAQPRQQDRTTQPRQQDRSGGFNRQDMDRQNAARERGNQNMQNRNSMQRSAPAGGGGGTRQGGGGGGRRR